MSRLIDCDSEEETVFVECEECGGQGFYGLYDGQGESERHSGETKRCSACGGSGEVEVTH